MPESVSKTVTFRVNPPGVAGGLRILTDDMPDGTFGTPYAHQFVASGGVMPYHWSVYNLPTGMTISPAGLVQGTPMTIGEFSPVVTVTDSSE